MSGELVPTGGSAIAEFAGERAPAVPDAFSDQEVRSREVGLRVVAEVRHALGDDWDEFEAKFDALPEGVLAAVEADLTWGPATFVQPASDDALKVFASRPEQAEMLREWGEHAPERFARLQQRLWRIADRLEDSEFQAALKWLDALSPTNFQAVANSLSKR